MSKPATGTGKARGNANWVATFVDLILELPEPGQEWTMSDIFWRSEQFDTVRDDVPDEFRFEIHDLARRGVVHRVGERIENTKQKNVWETDAKAYRYVEGIAATREELPCGHRAGFETVSVGEEYECGYKFCDARHGYDAVAEVYK